MNYLIIEGYKDAAEKFSEESGLHTSVDLGSIEERMKIRYAVQTGDIKAAIERVNDLNPDLLDTDPRLYFHLQQQHLIELIRMGKAEEALEFAQEELAPHGEEHPELLRELEKTMALLAFDVSGNGSPLGDLLDFSHRQKTANELNAALLAAHSQPKEPKLPALLQLLAWTQDQLDEKAQYPRINNIVSAVLTDPSAPNNKPENSSA
ncbi:Glucose-induced degradation complex subunit [Coemansia sp. RSA 2599]|nr:Glucose-induced degradation complex subunit [Coemansia sp. RSA 2598]KAJ1822162.1 Glucose-induced degradation complex subunit [Coemansia sp. RSA 2599]